MGDTVRHRTRVILILSFGSLLLLIVVLGFSAYRRSDRIYQDVTSIHDSYRRRANVLSEIQSNLYLSGILVRDYLLDPVPTAGVGHRKEVLEIRQSLDDRVATLEKMSASQDAGPLQRLRRELEAYWNVLDPAFEWTPERKAALAVSFLRKQVLPRRDAVLQMTHGIDQLDASSLAQEQERIASSWESYRGYLKWMLGCALSLALLTAGVSFHRLSALEKRANEHRIDLENAERRLRWLSQKLVRTQEEERKSLSRELHDEIGQMLTGIRMTFGNLEQLRTAPEEDFKDQVSEGKDLAEQTLQKVRNLAMGLRPSMLDDLGLEPALEWQAREFSRRSGIPVDFKTDGFLANIPEQMRTCVYRIVQESLTNCARHARAKNVWIDLQGGQKDVTLTVRDNGIGFETGRSDLRGLGLMGIEERARELGGAVSISSQPGRGTTLQAVLPLKEGTPL